YVEGAAKKDAAVGTPLHWAAAAGNPALVKLLLDHGANANARVPVQTMNTPMGPVKLGGETALQLAAGGASTECVELLLAHGARIAAVDARDANPLLSAVRQGRARSVELLIAAGAPVNPSRTSAIPLHVAAYYGHTEVARILLDHHADVRARDKNGSTAL